MRFCKWILNVAICTAAASCTLFIGREDVETPPYTVLRKDTDCELRQYGELQVVTTGMEGRETNQSFTRLYRYITGANADSEKIPMTAPVLMDRQSPSMSFIMPGATAQKGAPPPTQEKVELNTIAARKMAVHAFTGTDQAGTEKAAAERLLAWVKQQGLRQEGAPIFAYYDPPWTPVSKRRNEVMVLIQ
jgi:hypothetical protein